jgi:hypothetical protein
VFPGPALRALPVLPVPPTMDQRASGVSKNIKNTKAYLKVAALNMRGHGNTNVWHPANKWYEIWQIMLEQKIAVLLVGKAHMDNARKADIDGLF